MRWVQHAALRPHKCAVIPFVGNSNSQLGFVDTGVDLQGWDPHVYISGEAVKAMAPMFGLVASHETDRARRVIDQQREQIAELTSKLEQAERQLEAVHVLRSAGYTSARRAGRPPREKVKG